MRRAGSLKVLARIARSSGGRGHEPVDGVLQGRPQVGAAAEEADHDQGVERLDEDLVMRVAWIVEFVDGGGQQPVGGIDVARAVEQVVRPCHGGRERTARAWMGPAGLR